MMKLLDITGIKPLRISFESYFLHCPALQSGDDSDFFEYPSGLKSHKEIKRVHLYPRSEERGNAEELYDGKANIT